MIVYFNIAIRVSSAMTLRGRLSVSCCFCLHYWSRSSRVEALSLGSRSTLTPLTSFILSLKANFVRFLIISSPRKPIQSYNRWGGGVRRGGREQRVVGIERVVVRVKVKWRGRRGQGGGRACHPSADGGTLRPVVQSPQPSTHPGTRLACHHPSPNSSLTFLIIEFIVQSFPSQ